MAFCALTAFTFAPVARHEFVNFDDPQYVSENPEVLVGLSWHGLRWAFSSTHAGNWHPLTWLSHMLDVKLWGLRPGPHHVTSVLLHGASVLVLFSLFHRMTGALGRSAFVAGVFAVHPLHVESVAWVAERKDVLSTLLGLLALWAYLGYVRRPRPARYAATLGLFGLGLMAKPMLVTLPFVMLLLDVWPLRRVSLGGGPASDVSASASGATPSTWPRLLREKLPLFALALASSVVTFAVQQQAGAVKALETLPLGRRAANALVAYATYIGKALWPSRLAAVYPYPASLPGWRVAGSALLLLAVSVLVIRAARSRPYLLVGWLFYLGTLVPVIGLVQVGGQPLADRYTYVPLIGLSIMAAWGVPELIIARWPPLRVVLQVATALVIAACALTARAQVGHWRDSVALWEHALDVTIGNYRAHNNLGQALAKRGRTSEAVGQYSEALRLKPDYAEAHANLGLALAEQGRVDDAIRHYSEALRLLPDDVDAHNNFGVALLEQGRPEEAIPHFSEALRLRPDLATVHGNLADAHNGLGNALAGQGRIPDAIAQYEAALRHRPGFAAAHNGLGAGLAQEGRVAEAIAHYEEALRQDPDFADAHSNLATALAGQGRVDEAIREFGEALRLKPREPDFHYDLAVMLVRKGRVPEAVGHLEAALRLDPSHQAARAALQQISPRGRVARPEDPQPRRVPEGRP
jgi:tetratricopeptide (TPR) repeat protein